MLRCLLLISLLLGASAPHAEPELLAPNGVVPLSVGSGTKLFSQCSRPTPEPTAQVWRPSPEQVAEFEAALPRFIATLRSQGKRTPPDSQSYFRQYFGFTRDGEPFIYANLFPAEILKHHKPDGSLIVVCDGGPSFWGVVYNAAKRSFEPPAFNGAA